MGKHTDEVVHQLARRSWWDGSVIGMCGLRAAPGYYRERLVELSPVTCPGCRKAMRKN